MKDLVRVYGAVGKELRGDLLAIDPMNFNAVKADEIRTKTRRLTLALNLAAQKWVDEKLAKSYGLASRRTRVALEILGRKPRKQITSKEKLLRDRAIETLIKANISIRNTVDKFLNMTMLAARTITSAAVREFDMDEARGYFEGWAAEAVAKEWSRGELKKKIFDYLRDQINEEGLIEIINKNGKSIFWNPRKYAEMVARTEIRNAQTEATKDLCKEYENDLVQISDHNTICDECKEYEGNVYSISGNDPEYPALTDEPPYHPNCQHSMLPTSIEAIHAREIFG
jgi:SPP1 gp7 family putative phage head morphogenesis protein